MWHLTGEIYMESTGTSAEYDLDVEDEDIDDPTDALQVLNYLMQTGDLQIIPADAEYVEDEDA